MLNNDSDYPSMLGKELVVNGEFVDESEWNLAGCTISEGAANFLGDSATLEQEIALVQSNTYQLKFTTAGSYVKNKGIQVQIDQSIPSVTAESDGTHKFLIKVIGTVGLGAFFAVDTDGFIGKLSSVSIKEVL